jgi:putative Ca2+/H+ antiporter (TMEM165/GDT1 family)
MRASAVISVLVLTYWTVLLVELIGDKAIYTVTTLAARYRPAEVFAGISVAFMGKTAAAVAFGRILLQLPLRVTAGISAATLFITAVHLWRKRSERPGPPSRPEDVSRYGEARARTSLWWSNGFATSFAALFLTEWADVGQLSTAALAAQYRMPVAIWIGATAALMTKGILALTVGMQLRRHVPASISRVAAVACCAALGLLALGTALLH